MHELFTKVLSKRDLSRAGELFSVADSEIVNDLTEVLKEICSIITQPDYLLNSNDQSVVEICVTRIIICIRETNSAERHCTGLVELLETCLKYTLQPSSKDDNPPHAKISSDVISSIFLNYNKKIVMEVALPVAVKFLNKGNKELSSNLASYLSLAAIEYSYLLSPHVHLILESLVEGNYGLSRVLSQLFEVSPEPIIQSAHNILEIIPRCDTQEKLILLQLLTSLAKVKPLSLQEHIPQLMDLLLTTTIPSIITSIMSVLLKLAEHKPHLFIGYIDVIRITSNKIPQSAVSLAGQILSAVGKTSKERAQIALDFILEHLPNADRSTQGILLQEATTLCTRYPILFTDKVTAVVRQRNNLSQQLKTSQGNEVNQISGGITIVKLNSSSTANANNETNTSRQASRSTSKSSISVIPTNTNIVSTTVINTSSSTVQNINASNNQHHHLSNTSNGFLNQANLNTIDGNNTSSHAISASVTTQPTSPMSANNNIVNTNNSSQIVPPTGYTRRVHKLGDSRSTGRLHPGGNTHRSMTRLNIAGGSIGGLHKSMTRLSSSQQINQNGLNANSVISQSSINVENGNSQNFVTPVPPPLSQHVTITGENKWGIPSTKITSGGVTVTTSPTITRGIRPYSQGPSTLMGSGALGKGSSNGLSILNQSTGSIGVQNSISVHHASPASPTFNNSQLSPVLTLNSSSMTNSNNNQVIVSGPVTVSSRRNDNKSVTLLNVNSTTNQRMSVFEPYPMRDTIQHFCEKHLDKIKTFTDSISHRLPPPAKCTIEERRAKKMAKLHFACQARGPHCLYSKTFFTMRTRNPRTWIHLMFLDLQSRAKNALSSWDPSVSSLKHCWDTLKCENRTFITLVTSAFPNVKETDALVNELRNSGFFDVFELGPCHSPNASENVSTEDLQLQWGCFLCNHPEKASGFLQGNTQPVIEGQLKEKKGKWRLFRRWRTRYFTLSGAHLSCKGSSGGESIDVNQIRSVKVSRGARNIPKAFEIFTGDQTLILKPKDGKNAEEWVQCLSIVVAHSQARDTPTTKTNSLPARGISNNRIGSRTVF